MWSSFVMPLENYDYLPRTALRDARRTGHVFLKTAVISFLPNQSANMTSWKTNGDVVAPSVISTRTYVASAICGPLWSKNSSFDWPSLWWWITCNHKYSTYFIEIVESVNLFLLVVGYSFKHFHRCRRYSLHSDQHFYMADIHILFTNVQGE